MSGSQRPSDSILFDYDFDSDYGDDDNYDGVYHTNNDPPSESGDSSYDSWDDFFEAIERRREERVAFESYSHLEETVEYRLTDFTPADPKLGNEALDSEDVCLVCLVNKPDAILLACQHAGICCVCAHRLFVNEKRCPLCRHPIPSFRVIGQAVDVNHTM
jgi:hypothetical protein